MALLSSRRFATVLAAILISCSPAAVFGQANPLDAPPPAAPQTAVAPATPPPNPTTQFFIPDYVVPGARFIYYGTSGGNATAAGHQRYDVVAVTDSLVLINVLSYFGGSTGKVSVSGNSTMVLRAGAPFNASGGALWVSKEALAAMKSSNSTNVAQEQWPINGITYDATVLTRTDQNSAQRLAYDRQMGLLLATQLATGRVLGGEVNGFDRENSSIVLFQTYRRVDLPWLRSAAPAWTSTIRRLLYQGSQTMESLGITLRTAITRAVEVADRGPGWAVLRATTQYEGTAPTVSTSATGPGSIGGYWISPDVLRTMTPGVIDRDPTLGSTLSYQIEEGPMGRLGVLTETGRDGGYRFLAGYSLDDGALAYSRSEDTSMNVVTEFRLAGRE